MNWTQQHDYALTFGAALGLSDMQVSKCLGDGRTKNSIIGRRHRIGVETNPIRCRRIPKKMKIKSDLPRAVYLRPNRWTLEEDATLRANRHLTVAALHALLPNRSISALNMRVKALGIANKNRRFTAAEDEIIRTDYMAHVPMDDIAEKLNRSTGVIRQRIFNHLKLQRDSRKTRLMKKFGGDVLSISDDVGEIKRVLAEQDAMWKAKEKQDYDAKINKALDEMVAAIEAGADRKIEFQAAMIAGTTLQQIGDRVGVTRERIRQIVHGVRSVPKYAPVQPREIECNRCHTTFLGKGNKRYCDECQGPRAIERMREQQEYQKRLRQTPENKEYKRGWMAKSRVKDRLLSLEAKDLKEILSDVIVALDKKVT